MSEISNRDRFGPHLDDDDLLIDEMSVNEILTWMINGGVAWTIPLMDKDIADRIDHEMSFAYISLCAKISAQK